MSLFSDLELEAECQKNDWLKTGGVMFQDDPMADLDYTFCFTECKTLKELKEYFIRGNWAIRQGFKLENLAFVNQDNGGDEWKVFKKFPDGELITFESISMRHIILSCSHPTFKNPETWRSFKCEHYKHRECNIKNNVVGSLRVCEYQGLTHDGDTWEKLINRLLKATKKQCRTYTY